MGKQKQANNKCRRKEYKKERQDKENSLNVKARRRFFNKEEFTRTRHIRNILRISPFSENFDLGLFNPFDALSQDSLLTLDTRVEENLQNIQPLSPGLSQPVQQFNEKNSITFNSNCK